MNVCWQYGLLPPLVWDATAERELRLQIDLWNALVAIEDERLAAERRAVVADDPDLEADWSAFDRLCVDIDALPRRPPKGEDPAEWRRGAGELRDRRRTDWAALKPRIAAARVARAETLRAIRDARYAAVSAARRQSGLWWGNYNAVCADFDVALGRLRPGEKVRRHEWQGEGRLTNQLQHGCPAATMMQSGHAQVRIEPLPDDAMFRGRAMRRQLRPNHRDTPREMRLLQVTVRSEGRGTRHMASWPIVMHRPFPPGAIIKTVAVHRRRVGAPVSLPGRHGNPNDYRWTVTFNLVIPDPEAASPPLPACGIDLGWRIVEGGTRIATLADRDGCRHIVLPERWFERREALAATYGEAAKLRGVPDQEIEHVRLRHAVAHGVDRCHAARREFYRLVAKEIAERYQIIAIDRTNIGSLSRRVRAIESGERKDLPPAVRRHRAWAAVSTFVAEVERAARARGRTVVLATGPTTAVCHRCGHRNNPPDNWRADLVWRCEGCRKLWDQDENAARLILAAATRAPESRADGISVEGRKNQGLRIARMTRTASARKSPASAVELPRI